MRSNDVRGQQEESVPRQEVERRHSDQGSAYGGHRKPQYPEREGDDHHRDMDRVSVDDLESVSSERKSPRPSRNTFSMNNSGFQRQNRPKFSLRTFRGDTDKYDVDKFISTVDDYIMGYDKNSIEVRASVKSHLTCEAARVVIDAEAKKWDKMKEALLAQYRPDGEDRTHMAILYTMQSVICSYTC